MNRLIILVLAIAAGCQTDPGPVTKKSPPPPVKDSAEPVDPATFATWPSVNEKPVQVGPMAWALCKAPTAEMAKTMAAEEKANGPHASQTIVVRVSPEAMTAYRDGRALPVGAVVVKEKYTDAAATGPMHAYATMTKREPGYFPDGGDWEYGFVTLIPERKVTIGRLANCAQCHAHAPKGDSLFRANGKNP